MQRYRKWAERNHSSRNLLAVLIPAGVLFLLLIPFLLVISSSAIDRRLGLPHFTAGTINLITGLALIAVGFYLGLWSVLSELSVGEGTPVPMMPTTKLVVRGPYAYCRNPMTLGTLLAYLGIGVWTGSISAVAIVLIFVGLLLLYIKFLEEKELVLRFGTGYEDYKKTTPFILPRLRQRKP